jgi:gluconolactonase
MANTVFAEGLSFPEGPAFDREGNLYVVEIRAGQITKVAPDGKKSVYAKPGGGPNGSNFGPDGRLYVCNNGGFPSRERPREPGRLERVEGDGTVTVLVSEIDGEPLNSPNDLGFDEHGNLYFTDPVFGAGLESAPPGSVCFLDIAGKAKRLHTGLQFPNGIGVSPDGRTLVVCESITFKLHAFPILEPGVLGEPRLFGDLGQGAVPDGFAFDEEGYVLCCGYSSGKIHVFGPAGGPKVAEIPFEDPQVTNVCFGGPERRTLYVTESGTGRVVCAEWSRPGMLLFPDR